MITVRFKRCGNGIFIPHVDVMRSLNRAFRRAGIDVKYSNGFNHHMTMKMTQPLPFGVAEGDGYATTEIKSELGLKEVFERLSASVPDYLHILGVYETEKSPNLAGAVNASSYLVKGDISAEQADKINSVGAIYFMRTGKGDAPEKKDVGSLIYRLKADVGKFETLLAFGNVNLRIDLLMRQFNEDFGTDLCAVDAVRTAQYIKGENGLVSAEEYLEGLCREKYISNE